MSDLDDPDSGMTAIVVDRGEALTLRLVGAPGLRRRCPEQVAALVEAVAFVNQRRREAGEAPVLQLVFDDGEVTE